MDELLACCKALETEKITERKKQVDKFQRLLKKASVIRELDKNSDIRLRASVEGRHGARLFTWDSVFKVVRNLVLREADTLKNAKTSNSAITQSNREKKKQETSNLFKLVIRIADRRGERLKCTDVIQHILQVMSDDFLSEAFGIDYSNVLLKDVLTVRKYGCEIPSKMWHEILAVYCQNLQNPQPKADRNLTAQIVHAAMQGATSHCDVRAKKLFMFFSDYFSSVRQESSMYVTEHIMSAMNKLCQAVARDNRMQICQLGENIFSVLLYLWSSRPSPLLKDQIVEFFQLQLCAHHPKGCRSVEEGAYAVSWSVWKSHLRKLYEAIYHDISDIGGRSKLSSGQKVSLLKWSYVELAADLCYQIFSEGTGVIEVTQSSFAVTQPGGSVKKRRIETGWQTLQDLISGQVPTVQILPWLQLIGALLHKYPRSLPEEQFYMLVNSLQQLLSESKLADVTSCLLQCVQSLVNAYQVLKVALSAVTVESCTPVWQRIWLIGLRCVSLNHAREDSLSLLTFMLRSRLITPDKEMWSLFYTHVCPCTDASLAFLATFFKYYDLPENHRSNSLIAIPENSHEKQPLRRQLLHWMLPKMEETADLKKLPANSHLFSQVLVSLVLSDTSGVSLMTSGNPKTSSHEFGTLENMYLQTTFDSPLESVDDSCGENTEVPEINSVIVTLRKQMEELLVRDCEYLMELTEQEESILPLMNDYFCLILKVLCSQVKSKLISVENINKTKLTDTLKLLMTRISTVFCKMSQSCGLAEIRPVLRSLGQAYRWTSDVHVGLMKQFARSLTPAKLIEKLLDVAAGKAKLCRSTSGPDVKRSKHTGTANTSAFDDLVFDDLDADMDVDEEPSNGHDDFGIDDKETSQEMKTGDAQFEGMISLLSPSSLSEVQGMRLDALRVLCRICSKDQYASSNSGAKHADGDVKTVCKRLVNLIDVKSDWDPTKSLDLQMLKCIIDEMAAASESVSEDEAEAMLAAIRKVFKLHRKDQEICSASLELLQTLVPHLTSTDETTSETLQDLREGALHLVSVLWKLQNEGQYTVAVRSAMAQCMHSFIQYDPEGIWTRWKQTAADNSDDSDDESTDQQVALMFAVMLKDRSQEIRLYSAGAMRSLFVKRDDKQALNRAIQDGRFDYMYGVLQDLLPKECLEATDESQNSISTFLHTLATITSHSAVCEKKAVFAFCLDLKEKKIDLCLVKKVLETVRKKLGHKSISALMSTHLPYLIGQWLVMGYKLHDFPYQLLEHESVSDFYRSCYPVLIQQLVMHRDLSGVQAIGEELKVNWETLLIEVIPKVIVHILPMFASSKQDGVTENPDTRKKLKHASACYDLLLNTVGQKTIEDAIASHLDEIVVDILFTLFEPSKQGSTDRYFAWDSDPEPSTPHFSTHTITATLDYLTRGHSASATSLVAVLSKSQDGIQKILLALKKLLSSSHRLHEKRRVMLMYRLFVSLLLREFDGKLGANWAFVLRDVIHTLIYHMQAAGSQLKKSDLSDSEDLFCMCCDLLHDVCRTAIIHCPQELGRFLPKIVSPLVQYAELDGILGNQCMKLLHMLVVENDRLQEPVALLDPFPDLPVFSKLRQVQQQYKYTTGTFTLKQELEHFLSLWRETTSVKERTIEGLGYLREQLANRKNELAQLVLECEEVRSPLLMRVVSELVQLIPSADRELRVELARCLGEIGPCNLSMVTMAKPDDIQPAVFSQDSRMLRDCKIFHLLSEYLVDSSVDTVLAAGQVLKRILSTKAGLAFYTEYCGQVQQDSLFPYLHPFKGNKKKLLTLPEEKRSVEHFRTVIKDADLWSPQHGDHAEWIVNLVCALIDSSDVRDEILRLLQPICRVKVKFCEAVLPYLIHDILSSGVEEFRDVLSEQIGAFFSSHCSLSDQTCSRATTPVPLNFGSNSSICSNVESVKCMLNVIQYLRLQKKPAQGRQKTTAWDKNFWLNVDYLHLAKAAKNCSAYFTTLLYAEIWCDTQKNGETSSSQRSRNGLPSSNSQELSQNSQLEVLSSLSEGSGVNVQTLLLEAYRSIGDPDGVYGCGAGKLVNTDARIKTYEHENQWGKALTAYDLDMGSYQGQVLPDVGLLQALQKFGASHVLETYLHGLSAELQELGTDYREFQYENAWKNCSWEMDIPNKLKADCGFHQAVYCSLKSLKDDDLQLHDTYMKVASFGMMAPLLDGGATPVLREDVIAVLPSISHSSLESMRSLYPVLSSLLCLSQVDDVAQILVNKKGGMELSSVLKKWQRHDAVLQNDFDFIEPVLQMRCILLHLVGEKCTTAEVDIHSQIIKNLQHLAKTAVSEGRHQVAERAIHRLRRLDQTDHIWTWRVEEASMYWSRGEHDTAKNLIKSLLERLDKVYKRDKNAALLYTQCLGIYGNWLSETRSESPNVVMENYLSKAVDHYEKLGVRTDEALDAYLSLARYADSQYQNIVNYMKSSTFEAKQALVRKAKADAERLRQIGETNTRYHRTLDLQSNLDEQELISLNKDKEKYLLCAADNYIKCLSHGNRHDLRIFRLISLWFDNAAHVELNKLIQNGALKIKSYKFLPLMYQLAARMSVHSQYCELFRPTLDKMIEQTVLDHPHHTLFIIFALAHANKDDDVTSASSSSRSKRNSTTKLSISQSGSQREEEDRVKAAKKMIDHLKRSRIGNIVNDMEKLCCAYIHLANVNVSQHKTETKPINFSSNTPICQMKDLCNVAVPTVDIKVDYSCNYSNIVHVVEFSTQFRLAGGINLPKIITCRGSDGISRRQLVKGKDDLRQDAVMQQVFGMVNELLKKDREAHKRKLTVRTYKVIPLSQRSGLLEWCEGTQPLGDYLIGSSDGAHQRYRPNDMKPVSCRTLLAENLKKSVKERYAAYMEVCKKFQPVFRHFFMEKFCDPAVWYERRQAYTRSVATNSIVGYIVGLGDRHVQNILIDCQTAELVHIDLGVAFEQGRILPTPETVPFRLTRDIVDGMGVAGVEGVFRRCCERTMEVMRGNQEALLTILQVLLYDPLYAWTISPQKAYALQQLRERADPDASELNTTTTDLLDVSATNTDTREISCDNVNKVAERVLLRLQQKLAGYEDSVTLSVSGQVNHLIQEAKDPKNLCRVFPGWQPYL